MKHKYCEVIKLWADGAEIQFRDEFTTDWTDIQYPNWLKQCEYRVKPETLRYRVALVKNSVAAGIGTISTTSEAHARAIEILSTFIRWDGGWKEVEV